MKLPLKDYQRDSLKALETYLTECRASGDVDTAFYKKTRRGYNPPPEAESLASVPYVCLRIPTGGGKTLLGAHAVGTMLTEWAGAERGIVLWLAPTGIIVEQTRKALLMRGHPYREALEEAVKGPVAILTASEALSISPATVEGETVIIVCTMAALRVEETDGRKVYDDSGVLSGHFSGVTESEKARLELLPGTDRPVYSLANVLARVRPLVIIDEAHRFGTSLSFKALARFAPSCILELSATPETKNQNSNVLHRVSAYELKTDGMLKLPLFMQESPHWQESVSAAIACRDNLEKEAKAQSKSGSKYVRPIILFQAQRSNEPLTVDVLEKYLLEECNLPKDQIAVEYKNRNETEGIDLFAPTCPIRYIITVDKLREGWDCAFASVLCSVRESKSSVSVEQLLGRVLRMPYATRQSSDALNKAYCYVTGSFAQCVKQLQDALIESGFTREEAASAVQRSLPLTVDAGLYDLYERKKTPAERGELFSVPQLALLLDGETELLESEMLLPGDFKLALCDPSLTEAEFTLETLHGVTAELDISNAGKLNTRHLLETPTQYSFASFGGNTETLQSFAVWLDRHLPEDRIAQNQKQLFCYRVLEGLTQKRGLNLESLAFQRMRLRSAIKVQLEKHMIAAMVTEAQQLLFEQPEQSVYVGPEVLFTYDPDAYPVNKPHPNPGEFKKHYYREIEFMGNEERLLAQLLDSGQLPVRYWVRNIPQREKTSFWLPRASGHKFYPDFVVLLDDGRIFAIEYKGKHLVTADEAKEKDAVGKLWAASSKGHCLFAMVGKEDYLSVVSTAVRG